MKAGFAGLLALLLAAPACICPLQAASSIAPNNPHACCTQDAPAPLSADTEDGCPSGCGHCAQEGRSPQDLPKTLPSVQAPLPVMEAPAPSWAAVFFPALAPCAGLQACCPAPPGLAPAYLLHCAILC